MTEQFIEHDKVTEPEVYVKPKPSELGDFVGTDFQLPFSTPWVENTYELLREDEECSPTVRQLMGMRRTDGQARALYRLITLPIRSALRSSTFIPPADGSKGGEKEAEFVSNMFTLPPNAGGMEVPFHKVMAQILMALFDGFSPFEQIYWSPKTGPLKGKITLQKLAYRPAETVTFLTTNSGAFAGFRQRATVHGKVVDVKIDKEDAFYYAAQEEEKPFYGVSYFQSAFFHYDKKIKLYYIAHLSAQRNAVGTRIGTWPPNASEKDKTNFKKALADMGMSQWIGSPETFKVEAVTHSGTNFDYLSYINHHNSQMSKSVLAAFFDDHQGGGAADTTLVNFGQQSDAMFVLMLQTIMDEIAAQINHYIIPKFIDWNFNSGKYPTFKWGSFTDEQKAAIKATFDALATAGQSANVTPEFLFELEKKMAEEMGLEIDYDKIQQEHDQQKQLQQQADQLAMQQFGQQDPNAPVDPNAPPGQGPGVVQPGVSPQAPIGGGGAPSWSVKGGGGGQGAPAGPPGQPQQQDPTKLSDANTAQVVLSVPLDELARQLLISTAESIEGEDNG